MLVRTLRCPACGAPVTGGDDAVVLLCDHCGSFVAMDLAVGVHRDGRFAALAHEQLESMVAPSALQARYSKVAVQLGEAQQAEDRERWRPLAREFYALTAACYPRFVPGGGRDAKALARWYHDAVALGELQTFDASLRALMAAYQAAVGRLNERGDRRAAARDLIEAARRYYRAVEAHPDRPLDTMNEGVEHHARELARQAIDSLTMTLGPGLTTELLGEIFGDRQLAAGETLRCTGCGATIPDEGEGSNRPACPHCGGRVDVTRDDPWIESTLAIFRAVLDDLHRQGQIDSSLPAQSAAVYVVLPIQQGGEMSEDAAWRFMRRAVPWLGRDEVAAGIEGYRMATEEGTEERAILDALLGRLDEWEADPSLRPAPPAAFRAAAATQQGSPDPWVEQTLGWLDMAAPPGRPPRDRAQMALSYCLLPFQKGGSITIDQAMQVVEAGAIDGDAFREAIEPWRTGMAEDQALIVFLEALLERLDH